MLAKNEGMALPQLNLAITENKLGLDDSNAPVIPFGRATYYCSQISEIKTGMLLTSEKVYESELYQAWNEAKSQGANILWVLIAAPNKAELYLVVTNQPRINQDKNYSVIQAGETLYIQERSQYFNV